MGHNSTRPETDINWQKKFLVVGAAIVILTATGPFGTYRELELFTRIAYWSLAVIGVGTVMNLLAWYSLRFKFVQRLSWYMRMMFWVLVGSFPGTLIMLMVVAIFLSIEDAQTTSFFKLYLKLCLISSTICVLDLREFAFAGTETAAKVDDPAMPAPSLPPDHAAQRKFLNQLSHEIGDDVISVSTQDHYLDVTTTLGSNMIHGKLADAAENLATLPGIRLHRSHWAALNHIRRLQRRGSGHVVVLTDGRELPVSRSYLGAVRSSLGL